MANDPLKAAFAALREETAAASDRADATLERILAHADASKVRPLPRAVRWLPLAAVLAVSSAWAALDADGARSLWSQMSREPRRTMERGVEIVRAPAPQPDPVVTPPTEPEAAPPAASAAPPASAAPLTSARSAARVVAPATAAPATSPEDDARAADTLAFKSAYRTHTSGSPQESVAAWDAYLAAHPQGRFGPEARYARAIALVQAGRTAEARAALAPFAEAPVGGYRREDAARVLRTLESR